MSKFYGILTVIGWAWTVVVFSYLFIRLRREKNAQHGFEVVEKNEKHH